MKRAKTENKINWKMLVLFVFFIFICLAYNHVRTQIETDKHMEKIMQAFAMDPDAIRIQDSDHHDITEQFMGTYLDKICKGKYQEPIEVIRKKAYHFSIKRTPRNEDFLYQMEE